MASTAIPSDVTIAMAQLHAAMGNVANGDISAIKALYSRSDDATSFFGWGGYEKGWDSISKRWDWAGQQFQGGNVSHETVSVVVTPEMFFTTDIESYSDQHMAGVEGVTGWTNRVTHIFRREDGGWRLLHRHANRLEDQFTPAARLKPTAS